MPSANTEIRTAPLQRVGWAELVKPNIRRRLSKIIGLRFSQPNLRIALDRNAPHRSTASPILSPSRRRFAQSYHLSDQRKAFRAPQHTGAGQFGFRTTIGCCIKVTISASWLTTELLSAATRRRAIVFPPTPAGHRSIRPPPAGHRDLRQPNGSDLLPADACEEFQQQDCIGRIRSRTIVSVYGNSNCRFNRRLSVSISVFSGLKNSLWKGIASRNSMSRKRSPSLWPEAKEYGMVIRRTMDDDGGP